MLSGSPWMQHNLDHSGSLRTVGADNTSFDGAALWIQPSLEGEPECDEAYKSS
jgi:hypothetical protein